MKRALVLSLLLLVPACERAQSGGAAGPDQPPPAELIGYGTLPPQAIDQIGAFATAIGSPLPVTSKMIADGIGEVVEARNLKNVDAKSPMHFVLLDPKKHKRPLLLVLKVDAKSAGAVQGATAKSAGGWAVVGEQAAVNAASGWALTTLLRAPVPPRPTVVIKSETLLRNYRQDIEALGPMMALAVPDGNQAMGKIMGLYVDGLLALLEASDELRLVVDIDAKGAATDFVVVPKKGGDLAKFAAAQKPLDPALLKRLPAASPGPQPMVVVGHLEGGPYRDRLLRSVLGAVGGLIPNFKLDDALLAKVLATMDLMTGDFAAWMRVGATQEMAEWAGVTDGAKAMTAMREMVGLLVPGGTMAFEMMGIKMTYTFTPSGAPIEGIAPIEWGGSVDVSSLPEEQRELFGKLYAAPMRGVMLAADKWMVATMGLSPEATAAAVRAAKGGGDFTASPAAQAAVNEAAARKDSVVMLMSVIDIMASNPMVGAAFRGVKAESAMSFSFGFADGSVHMRLGVPAAHVKEIMKAVGGGMGGSPAPESY